MRCSQQGSELFPPIDIKHFPYIDLCNPANQRIVREIIEARFVSYIHFGTPCTVFSRARHNIANHSRARQRELVGCELATFIVEMCCLASRLGIKWSIENPRSSRLWEFPCLMFCMVAKTLLQLTSICVGTIHHTRSLVDY